MLGPDCITPERAERFWSRVDQSGGPDACWPWTRALTHAGYGAMGIGKTAIASTHRLAYVLTHGDIPPGMLVCHHCDNRRCCNPAHLFLGTQADNMADAARKMRTAIGERQGRNKLTEADVRSIREMSASGLSHEIIAPRFGVSRACISLVVERKRWAHVA